MPYMITIVRKDKEDFVSKEWKKLWDYTEKEQQESKWDAEKRDKQYGYVETPATRYVDTEVLKQTVETLDIAKVIVAINGL